MSDNNDSGGIIGAIISIFILAAIWPYLLAILGLYIAYLAVIAILEWIAQNPLTVVSILLTASSFYTVFRYRLIPKAWRWAMAHLGSRAFQADLSKNVMAMANPDLGHRKFIPSTNLYCYWCTKKLGIKAWEKKSKYYCNECSKKF